MFLQVQNINCNVFQINISFAPLSECEFAMIHIDSLLKAKLFCVKIVALSNLCVVAVPEIIYCFSC